MSHSEWSECGSQKFSRKKRSFSKTLPNEKCGVVLASISSLPFCLLDRSKQFIRCSLLPVFTRSGYVVYTLIEAFSIRTKVEKIKINDISARTRLTPERALFSVVCVR